MEENKYSLSGGKKVILNPFSLTCGRYTPGKAADFLESITDPEAREICRAELLYYQGKTDASAEICGKLISDGSVSAKIAAYLTDSILSVSTGDAKKLIKTLRLFSESKPILNKLPEIGKTVDFFSLYFNITICDTENIVLPPVGLDAFSVPSELLPIAVYIYANYLYQTGDTGRATGLAEATLIHTCGSCPVSEIYLSLIIAVCYISRGEHTKAEYYFDYAFDKALPDGIIMPFVELRGMLAGMFEKKAKTKNRDFYKAVVSKEEIYHKNWVKVHNEITGCALSDKLTSSETNICVLTVKGLSNTEIAQFLGISVNSVRAHLRNIFTKLDISSRKEIKDFVIK